MLSRWYDWLYRMMKWFRIPAHWVFGSHPELAELVESGRISQRDAYMNQVLNDLGNDLAVFEEWVAGSRSPDHRRTRTGSSPHPMPTSLANE